MLKKCNADNLRSPIFCVSVVWPPIHLTSILLRDGHFVPLSDHLSLCSALHVADVPGPERPYVCATNATRLSIAYVFTLYCVLYTQAGLVKSMSSQFPAPPQPILQRALLPTRRIACRGVASPI